MAMIAGVATPAEVVWELDRKFAIWSAELLFKGESAGWMVSILRAGDHVIGHRFALKADALSWAEMMRQEIASWAPGSRQAVNTGKHGGVTMPEATMRPGDEELWVRCFTAAITGMTGRGGQPQPEEIARVCGAIADGALIELRRRRETRGAVSP